MTVVTWYNAIYDFYELNPPTSMYRLLYDFVVIAVFMALEYHCGGGLAHSL